jgi:hypothetical protein
MYALFAAKAFETPLRQYNKIIAALEDKDQKEFKTIRKQGLPVWFHLVMATISFFIIKKTMQLNYEDTGVGYETVFGSAFLIYVLFKIVLSLENPTGGIWRIRKIPKEWLEEKESKNPPKQ